MQTFQIKENQAGQRLDKFLHKFMPEAGTGFLYKMLRKKNIVLNGKKAEGKEMLAVGDTVSFFFSDETFFKFTGKNAASQDKNNIAYKEAYRTLKGLTVLYEDSNILVLNKPAGVLTQKDDSGLFSANEWMIGYLLESGKITEETLKTYKPSVQNRLDRNTSGIVLCGISLAGSQLLARLIHDRSVRKYYYTLVKGSGLKETKLEGYLVKDTKTNSVRISDKEETESSAIRTYYKPIAAGTVCFEESGIGKNEKTYSKKNAGMDITLLEVELITGKTHQIRAHMASTGHPVLGDYKYGDRQFNAAFKKKYDINYQLLHAARIEFPDLEAPFTQLSNKVFTAELPTVFEEVLKDGNVEFQRS
ncbi:MAG: RluA family pseudouridine synthase [Lachnospiraceae bacterium]|nr:RluA family pseudouridine synthase [Lachnospiraceae bacterium]